MYLRLDIDSIGLLWREWLGDSLADVLQTFLWSPPFIPVDLHDEYRVAVILLVLGVGFFRVVRDQSSPVSTSLVRRELNVSIRRLLRLKYISEKRVSAVGEGTEKE